MAKRSVSCPSLSVTVSRIGTYAGPLLISTVSGTPVGSATSHVPSMYAYRLLIEIDVAADVLVAADRELGRSAERRKVLAVRDRRAGCGPASAGRSRRR